MVQSNKASWATEFL